MSDRTVYSRPTHRSFDEALQCTRETAARSGFGVMHVHNLHETLAKNGFSTDPTAILEICNPGWATKALSLDPRAALLIPCKIAVQEKNGEVFISALLPSGIEVDRSLDDLVELAGANLKSVIDIAAGDMPHPSMTL